MMSGKARAAQCDRPDISMVFPEAMPSRIRCSRTWLRTAGKTAVEVSSQATFAAPVRGAAASGHVSVPHQHQPIKQPPADSAKA